MDPPHTPLLRAMGAETVRSSQASLFYVTNMPRMLYMHWVTFWPGKWLEEPERAGFLSMDNRPGI